MRYIHFGAWLVCLTILGWGAGAQQTDPHSVYETKCGGCHSQHASDFSVERLVLDQDVLTISKSGRPLEEFLLSGHGGANPKEVDALIELLTQIELSDRLFQTKCKICHVRAKETARLNLVIRDDRLVGRYTGWDTEVFLANHGRLGPEEIPVILAMLKRQVLTKPPMWP